jgi:hypothetical protein
MFWFCQNASSWSSSVAKFLVRGFEVGQDCDFQSTLLAKCVVAVSLLPLILDIYPSKSWPCRKARLVKNPLCSWSYCSIPLRFLIGALLHRSLTQPLLNCIHVGVCRLVHESWLVSQVTRYLFTWMKLSRKEEERGSYWIQPYVSFIQHKSPKILCNPEVFLKVVLTLKLALNNPK